MAVVTDKSEEVPTNETEAIAENSPAVAEAAAPAPAAADAVAAPAADAAAPAVDAAAPADGADITKKEKQIIRQIHYYFSDANLARDKFLTTKIAEDEAGWVPLSVLVTFKRLAELTTDFAVIVKALEKSDEGLVEVSEDKEKVRRHHERPIPESNEELRKEMESRTLYVKGFRLDLQMSELLDFFGPEKVAHIYMRKYHDKPTKSYKFKGSVFVTFETKAQAEELLSQVGHKHEDRDLLVKWQADYTKEKRLTAEQGAQKRKAVIEAAAVALAEKYTLPKGTVLFFDGIEGKSVSREMLREAIEENGGTELAYIDFSKGESKGYFRFQEANAAVTFAEKLTENKLKLSDEIEVVVRVLDGEEEQQYLEKTVEAMKNRRNNHKPQNKSKGAFGNRKRRYGGDRNDSKRKRHNNHRD